ncbi:hypothetical protein Hanom_Chr12g01164541 [Helianthus anomalus]
MHGMMYALVRSGTYHSHALGNVLIRKDCKKYDGGRHSTLPITFGAVSMSRHAGRHSVLGVKTFLIYVEAVFIKDGEKTGVDAAMEVSLWGGDRTGGEVGGGDGVNRVSGVVFGGGVTATSTCFGGEETAYGGDAEGGSMAEMGGGCGTFGGGAVGNRGRFLRIPMLHTKQVNITQKTSLVGERAHLVYKPHIDCHTTDVGQVPHLAMVLVHNDRPFLRANFLVSDCYVLPMKSSHACPCSTCFGFFLVL